jgi:hypothetical protein
LRWTPGLALHTIRKTIYDAALRAPMVEMKMIGVQ